MKSRDSHQENFTIEKVLYDAYSIMASQEEKKKKKLIKMRKEDERLLKVLNEGHTKSLEHKTTINK